MPTPFAPVSLGYAALSVSGQVRTHNEDAVLCCPALNLWAVADGMGGHQRGEVASALALDTLLEAVHQGELLEHAVHSANAAIIEAGEQDPDSAGMGTTLVAVRFTNAQFELAWVGDSRAYRVSGQGIEQVSRDHSLVQELIDAGELSPDEARNHPRRNVVTRCLGQPELSLEVSVVSGTLAPGELLLLCSDGLSGEVRDEQIQQRCASAATLDELVEQLIASANEAGGRDNISCIVIGLAVVEQIGANQRPQSFLRKLLNLGKL
ncbi:Stp1/IreP family PP2C-type Ser/Thr phosphatase [Pseudomonas sp. GV071]|jgi:protein phosphatase|uniref:Stp1/IreP family PP2C-type Ser/Thr phosphatase n=1 Tax=Pseudomonas sp. GV071 TaxID=2135754 RepID=UPI000D35521D|nr:Stp1/IreP family PP2C-type Ser/Thr phosphatase [Pseudomonas sp. GV071]PTQ70111.1 protein phosphatase [Pseudomonas sp. GV071]